jgi:MFS family permease
MIYPFFLVNIAVLAFSSNLYGAFASDIQATCDISIQGIGTILSVSQIGTILAFLIYPAILRKYGPYRTMWLGVFGMGLSNILIAFSRTTATFAIRFVEIECLHPV